MWKQHGTNLSMKKPQALWKSKQMFSSLCLWTSFVASLPLLRFIKSNGGKSCSSTLNIGMRSHVRHNGAGRRMRNSCKGGPWRLAVERQGIPML